MSLKQNDEFYEQQEELKNEKDILWCYYHGLLCTRCENSIYITEDELKKKTYDSSQWGKLKITPYENYIKNFKYTE